MRQVRSRGSAKAFYIDRDQALAKLRETATDALRSFPEIAEVLLFGSLARGTHTGLSDVDLAIVLRGTSSDDDPIERVRPYQTFFFRRLGVGVDLIAFQEGERGRMAPMLEGAVVLAKREGAE